VRVVWLNGLTEDAGRGPGFASNYDPPLTTLLAVRVVWLNGLTGYVERGPGFVSNYDPPLTTLLAVRVVWLNGLTGDAGRGSSAAEGNVTSSNLIDLRIR
jgi:hypothetical protein